MKRTADIDQILRPLKDAPFQAYLSNAVQVADILEWILSQVGTAAQDGGHQPEAAAPNSKPFSI